MRLYAGGQIVDRNSVCRVQIKLMNSRMALNNLRKFILPERCSANTHTAPILFIFMSSINHILNQIQKSLIFATEVTTIPNIRIFIFVRLLPFKY